MTTALTVTRKFLTVEDIQKEYLPISKKKIRSFVKKYLHAKQIGNRIYVERQLLENLLSDPERESLPLT